MEQPSQSSLVKSVRLPAHSCNSHCHIVGPFDRFPLVERQKNPPSEATKEDLFRLHDDLGIQRTVIVESVVHGFNHDIAIDAIKQRPADTLAVALVEPDIDPKELLALTKMGFRGARFHLVKHMRECVDFDVIREFAQKAADANWHIQLHLHGDELLECAREIPKLPVPVVIDHMAYPNAALGVKQPEFQCLMDIMEALNIWVKVSGCDRATRAGPPYYDVVPFAAALVERYPDRVLWGTDWPHLQITPPSDDYILVDFMSRIAPSEESRIKLLVDNPDRLYGFNALAKGISI